MSTEETKKQKLEELETHCSLAKTTTGPTKCAFVLDFWSYAAECSTFVDITQCKDIQESIEGKPAYKSFSDAYRLQIRFSEEIEEKFYDAHDFSSSYVVAVPCPHDEEDLLREIGEEEGALEKEVEYIKGLDYFHMF